MQTRESIAEMPEFQVLESIAYSKRHLCKNLEIQQALADFLGAFPPRVRPAAQPELTFARVEMPAWAGMLADEVCR